MKFLSIVGGTFLLVATGCKLDSDSDASVVPAAYVNLYQASPDAPGLSIVLDQKVINSTKFDYTDNTGYLKFFAGTRRLQFGPFGASNVVADTTMKFEDAKAYSVYVVNTFNKIDLLVLNDDTNAPTAGKAKVRFLNLSPDAPEVDLQINDTSVPVATGVSFKEPSSFTEIDANKYTFVVKTTTGDVLLTLPNALLLDGWSYTIIVRGFKTPPVGSESVLSAELIVD
ncbi:MAG: DUF4397 domain-containing protein [Bacteroidota bacterium]